MKIALAFLIIFFFLIFLPGSAGAEEFILRPTTECCDGDTVFQPGSWMALLNENGTAGRVDLTEPGPFALNGIEKGKYDLVVGVEGYYPTKFLDMEIGSDGNFDYELVSELLPLSSSILEGHLIVKFRKTIQNEDIRRTLNDSGVGVLHSDRRKGDSDKPEHKIDWFFSYAEVHVTYDRSDNIRDLIERILLAPGVIDCTPISFALGK
jgi:hypothetical protein